ncbi:MAG: hypothetical protein D6B26_03510, partial [Spirochaetaceae bacterium]
EWNPLENLQVSIEGYYKYLFNRFYYNIDRGESMNDDMEILVHSDGIGHVAGADLLLHRHQGRYWDGYLSYTFSWVRLYNPDGDGNSTVSYPSGAPAEGWYYPDYHRFHNLNLILGFRPAPGININARFSFASGAPEREPGEITAYEVDLGDGTIIDRYARTTVYNDSRRTDFSIPLDLRISVSNYYKNSKIKWEHYFAVENLLVLVYSPKTISQFDSFSGEEIPGGDQADFSIGFPLPSFGFKMSY